MDLDTILIQTTWNDAAGAINNNFSKINQALQNGGGGGGSTLFRLDSWAEYTADKAGYVLSAKLGYELNTRVGALETGKKGHIISVSGSGNVLTGVSESADGRTLTFTKGTALTAHQSIYALTIQKNGTDVGSYNPKTAAKTINITDVASANTLSTHMGNGTVHITAAERTKWDKVVSDFAAITGSDSDTIINKWEEVVAFLDTYTEADTLANLLGNKVDKVSGKGLSTNDFTSALLTKLNGIEAGANKYVLPTASASVLGGIKVGSGLSMSNGVLSSTYSYSLPVASGTTLGGIKVGTRLSIDANGVLSATYTYSLPTASPTVLGGVKVGGTLAISSGILNLKSGIVTAGNYQKVTVDTYGRVTGGGTLTVGDIPQLPWSIITSGKPTTLAGYGITDAKIANGVITLGSNTITPLTSHQSLANYYTKTESDGKYVTALGTSGNYLTWTKNGVVHNLTVPFATEASYLSGGSISTWGTLTAANGYSNVAAYDYGAILGAFAWAGKGGQMSMQIDGFFYQNEGKYQCLDTNNYTSTLDGRYVKNSGGTMTGKLTINSSGSYNQLTLNNTAGGESFFFLQSGGVDKGAFTTMQPSYGTCIYDATSVKYLGIKTNGTPHFQGNTLWHAGNDGSGSGLDADLLDGHHKSSFNSAARYGTMNTINSGYYKIKIKSTLVWMLGFKILAYQNYYFDEINISGYNFGTSYWYAPAAALINSQGNVKHDSLEVKFGYDSAWNLWVAIPANNYTGILITDVVNGYKQVADINSLFEIVYETTLTGTTQVTKTPSRGATIGDNVASATKWAKARTITLTGSVTGSVSIDGSANVVLLTETNHTHPQYLTAHQSIYDLTIQGNGDTIGTFDPNGAAKTINITPANIGAATSAHTHTVKINGAVKTIAPSNSGTAVDLGTYLTAHQSLAAYLTKTDAAATYQPKGNYLTEHQAVSNKAATLAWSSTVTLATVGDTDITAKLPALPHISSLTTTINPNTRLYLVGVATQSGNAKTYTNNYIYIDTDNNIYNSGDRYMTTADAEIVDGTITINGTSITPITSTNLVTLDSAQTITANKTFTIKQTFSASKNMEAIYMQQGYFSGFRPCTRVLYTGQYLKDSDVVIVMSNSGNTTPLYLLLTPERGQMLLLYHTTTYKFTVNGNGKSIRVVRDNTTQTTLPIQNRELWMFIFSGTYWEATLLT